MTPHALTREEPTCSAQRTPLKIAAVAVGVALAATACGSSSDDASSDPTTAATTGAVGTAATATKAADLRAGLTYLLEEHVQLAGLATPPP